MNIWPNSLAGVYVWYKVRTYTHEQFNIPIPFNFSCMTESPHTHTYCVHIMLYMHTPPVSGLYSPNMNNLKLCPQEMFQDASVNV